MSKTKDMLSFEILGILGSLVDRIEKLKMIPTKQCLIELDPIPDINRHVNLCDFIIGETQSVKKLVQEFYVLKKVLKERDYDNL